MPRPAWGFFQAGCEMGKRCWLAWLASGMLHLVPVATLYSQIDSLNEEAALPSQRTLIEARLYENSDPDKSDLPLPASPDSSVIGESSSGAENALKSRGTAEKPNDDTLPNMVLPVADTPYVPAGQLDSRPYPENPVILPVPDAPLPKPKITAVLVLYIGTDGRVDRVEVEQSELPPPFEKAAIDAFQQAQMQPGIQHGKAVRARMKIQVEFGAN